MPRSAYYQLVDRALGGELDSRLETWRRARVSKRAAAALLCEELGGISINPDTIRRWMNQKGRAA